MPMLFGGHAAQQERELRGYQWLWPGTRLPPAPATFRSAAFQHPFSAIGLRLAAREGGQILPGVKGYQPVPFDCNIDHVTLLADKQGSVLVDIYKGAIGSVLGPSNTISPLSAFKPALANARATMLFTLDGWTTKLLANEVLAFDVLNVSGGISTLTITLFVKRNSQP